MPSKYAGLRFKPRWWAFLLALAACGATLSLGNWQTRRAAEKRVLAARFDAAERAAPVPVPGVLTSADALVFKRLQAKGEFVPKFTVLLDNKIYKGRVGYYVVTPLRLSDSALHVLVNRGWIAGNARREDLPQIRTPAGEVSIDGLGLAHAQRVLAAGDGIPAGTVWQGLTNEDFSRWSGLALQPVFLQQKSSLDDGLVRDWPAPDFGVGTHESYAIQWYLIATLSMVIFISLSVKREYSSAG